MEFFQVTILKERDVCWSLELLCRGLKECGARLELGTIVTNPVSALYHFCLFNIFFSIFSSLAFRNASIEQNLVILIIVKEKTKGIREIEILFQKQ